jgi:hypothetical protein
LSQSRSFRSDFSRKENVVAESFSRGGVPGRLSIRMFHQTQFFMALALLCSALSGYLSPCRAATAYDLAGMSKAKALYYRAISGDESARKQSATEFDRLADHDPDNPEVIVYRGSLKLLEAGKTWAVWRKYELSKQGIILLDSAVERAPTNLEVRFVRAATTRKLPGYFDRTQQSRDDLVYLASRVAIAARQGELDPALASAALYFFAEDVATGEQKTKALREAVKIAPDSQAGLQAARALRESEQ